MYHQNLRLPSGYRVLAPRLGVWSVTSLFWFTAIHSNSIVFDCCRQRKTSMNPHYCTCSAWNSRQTRSETSWWMWWSIEQLKSQTLPSGDGRNQKNHISHSILFTHKLKIMKGWQQWKLVDHSNGPKRTMKHHDSKVHDLCPHLIVPATCYENNGCALLSQFLTCLFWKMHRWLALWWTAALSRV